MVLLDPGTHVFELGLICKTIFSRSATLTFSSFAVLWATSLHSTSFERSDSYLFGFSLEMGIISLLKGTLILLKDVIYISFYVGTEEIRHPWSFLGFWRGLGLWPQFFDLNQLICELSTWFFKELSHSSPHKLKITKPIYLQISLHHTVENLFVKT